MDNLSYLNQISASAAPPSTKKSTSPLPFLQQKGFRIFIIIAGAIIVLSIIFGIISSIFNRETDYVPRLQLRTTNLYSTITDYSSQIKSSSLRAANSSLATIIGNMSDTLSTYIDPKYEIPPKVEEEEEAISSELSAALFEAKINGLLDRTYARQLAYSISIILSLEEEALSHTSDQSIKAYLTTSAENLNKILPAFSEYSDTSK